MYAPVSYADLTPGEIRSRMSPHLQWLLVELRDGRRPYLSTHESEQLRMRGLLSTTGRVTPLGWAVAAVIKEYE